MTSIGRSTIQQLIPETAEFERQLVSWHESLPLSVVFPDSPATEDSELRYFLLSRYYLTAELLHRPFLCYSIHNHGDASKCLAFAFSYHIHSNHTHRHHGKWLQLRREVTAACLLLAAFGNGIEMPLGWRSGVDRAQKHLHHWSTEASFLGCWAEVVRSVNRYYV